MPMDMYLFKLDIYQDAIAPNYFESHTNFLCPDFFQKKSILMSGLTFTLSDVTSFLQDNPTRLKNIYIQSLEHIIFSQNLKYTLNRGLYFKWKLY